MCRADLLSQGNKRSWSSGFELDRNGLLLFMRTEKSVAFSSLVLITIGSPGFERDDRKDERINLVIILQIHGHQGIGPAQKWG